MATATKKATAKKTAAKKKTTTKLAVMGSGEMSAKAIKSALTDYVGSLTGEVSFVVPVMKDLFTPAVKEVTDYLIAQEIPYEAVADAAAGKSRNLKPYVTNAEETHELQKGHVQKLVRLLDGADEGKLLVFLDEDDTALETAMDKAFESDLSVLAVNQGMDELEPDEADGGEEDSDEEEEDDADDDDAEDEDEDEDDADEEEAPATKKKTKPAAAASGNGSGEKAAVKTLLKTWGEALIDASKTL